MLRTARRMTTTVAAVALTLSGLSACGGDAEQKASDKIVEKALENGSGGDVDVDTSDDQVTVDTEDGTVAVGQDVDLPDRFPDSIPMPLADHTITSASTQGDEMAVLVSLTDADVDLDAEKEHLVSGLTTGGWTVDEPFSSAGGGAEQLILTATTDGWGLQVVVSVADGEAMAAYTLGAGD